MLRRRIGGRARRRRRLRRVVAHGLRLGVRDPACIQRRRCRRRRRPLYRYRFHDRSLTSDRVERSATGLRFSASRPGTALENRERSFLRVRWRRSAPISLSPRLRLHYVRGRATPGGVRSGCADACGRSSRAAAPPRRRSRPRRRRGPSSVARRVAGIAGSGGRSRAADPRRSARKRALSPGPWASRAQRSGYESCTWRISLIIRDTAITTASFAARPPARGRRVVAQLRDSLTLRRFRSRRSDAPPTAREQPCPPALGHRFTAVSPCRAP